MNTYNTVLLTICGMITLVALGLAVDTYLKFKLERESLGYSLSHIGIIWLVLVGSLLLGGASTASIAEWLSEHTFLLTMLYLSALTLSAKEAFRRRHKAMLLVSCLLFVGVIHYVAHNNWLTVMWIIVAVIVYCCGDSHIDSLIYLDDSAAKHPPIATTPNYETPEPQTGHRVIWQRQAEASTDDVDISFQKVQRGYEGSDIPCPLEPTFRPFTETVTSKD